MKSGGTIGQAASKPEISEAPSLILFVHLAVAADADKALTAKLAVSSVSCTGI